jgi:hypothetical protein
MSAIARISDGSEEKAGVDQKKESDRQRKEKGTRMDGVDIDNMKRIHNEYHIAPILIHSPL